MRRIRSGPVKIGLVVGAYVVGFLLALLVAASAGMTASMVVPRGGGLFGRSLLHPDVPWRGRI